MEFIAEREDTLFSTRFLFITTSTTKGSIKFIFIESMKQSLRLHYIGMYFASMSKRSYSCMKSLHIAFDNQVPAVFLSIFITELNHLFEFPFGIDMHQWKRNFPRVKSFFGQTNHYRGVLSNAIQHHRILKLRRHFADYMNRLGFEFF